MLEQTLTLPTTQEHLERALLALADNNHDLRLDSGEVFRMSRFQQQGPGLFFMTSFYRGSESAPWQPVVPESDKTNARIITLAVIGESPRGATVLSKCIAEPSIAGYWQSLLEKLQTLYSAPERASERQPRVGVLLKVASVHERLKQGYAFESACRLEGTTRGSYRKYCEQATGEESLA